MLPRKGAQKRSGSFRGGEHHLHENRLSPGFSVPRNKEIMRVFRDLEIVEQLGSGIPRILEAYGQDVFEIRESFVRIVLPYAKPLVSLRDISEQSSGVPVTPQVTPQVRRLLECLDGDMGRAEIMDRLGLKDRMHFSREYIAPALDGGFIEMTIPDKPRSSRQKYRLTDKGREVLEKLGRGELELRMESGEWKNSGTSQPSLQKLRPDKPEKWGKCRQQFVFAKFPRLVPFADRPADLPEVICGK
jgi:predicted transcriptional regulator